MNRLPPGALIVGAATMRSAEEAAFAGGASQDELMERAGRAVAQEVVRFAAGRRVLVLAGPGNNGGDAFVTARYCREHGLDVTVAASGASKDGAAARMRTRWTGPTVTLTEAAAHPVVVDGLFGIGLTRPIDPVIVEPLVRLTTDAFVIAIDVPSGCEADGGFAGPFRADATVALGALKPAHVVGETAGQCGIVLLADLGIPIMAEATVLARPRIDPPARDAHKYRRGLVMVIAGEMPGASRLAARAALAGGAGYVVLAGGTGGPDALVHRSIDDALADDRSAVLLIGPGLGRGECARRSIEAAMATKATLVLDGDALSTLGTDGVSRIARRDAPTILTPHESEFSRMFPSGDGNKIDRTRIAARTARATIVHKGPDTVIADAQGRVVVGEATSWLSTAGTGDVLAGLIAARVVPGGDAAAAQGVWLHGRAGRLAGPAFVADDLIGQLGGAIAECR